MELRGSFTALVTPFDRKGHLDRKTLEKLVEWQIAEGTDGIICSATTGEGPCLTDGDRKKNAEICIEVAAGRVPVIVATGINDTRQSIRYTEMAQKLGADGCLVVTPYYNRPTQRGCYLHFQEVAKVGLPIIVYHNPPRTAVRLTVETVEQLSQIPNVVGLKDSNHDIEFFKKIRKFLPVFSGDDDFTFELMKEGGVGSIAVTPNLIPRGWKQMVDFCLKGQWEKARVLFERYVPLCKAIFLETNPQGIKFALSWFNYCKPVLRLPMVLPTASTQREIKKEIVRLALPFCSFKRVLDNI